MSCPSFSRLQGVLDGDHPCSAVLTSGPNIPTTTGRPSLYEYGAPSPQSTPVIRRDEVLRVLAVIIKIVILVNHPNAMVADFAQGISYQVTRSSCFPQQTFSAPRTFPSSDVSTPDPQSSLSLGNCRTITTTTYYSTSTTLWYSLARIAPRLRIVPARHLNILCLAQASLYATFHLPSTHYLLLLLPVPTCPPDLPAGPFS